MGNDYGTVTLTHSTVSGNSARYSGGGMDNYYGTVTLTHSTVSGNSAGYNGGGVRSYGSSSTLTLTYSTVSGNSAGHNGGGLLTHHDNGSTVTLTNSTVSGNSAGGAGGGVFNIHTGLTLAHSTVTDNSAGSQGGGVRNFKGSYYGGIITLSRSLISGNTAPTGAEVSNYYDTVTADNFNLFGHGGLTDAQAFEGFTLGASDITATSGGTNTPLANILDTTLASNGGPTQTHALMAGSPAIDASPVDADCEATDQRGITRPQGAACDIGAFELESSAPPRLIYGVQGASKSQFFTVDEASLAVNPVGPPQPGRDIEGLDLHPTTLTLYGTAGEDNRFGQKGFLFTVDKDTGALTPVGRTGFRSVEALSFHPTDGSLWGWAEDRGLVTINLTTGAATRVLRSSKGVEGLAWNNAGTLLYASAGRKLFVYNPATNRLSQIASNLPGRTEALEMRPDGLLAVGVEGLTAIQAYDPIAKQPVPAEAIPTGFNDVEGIAWPE